jgi:hypothetical protein
MIQVYHYWLRVWKIDVLNCICSMTFFNVVDWDVFVKMSILKSSITTIGQFVGTLFSMVFKIEFKYSFTF